MLCNRCTDCANARPPPSRAPNSGLRADGFGYLVFIDHADIQYNGTICVAFLELGAAPSLGLSHVHATLETVDTLDNLRG